MSKLYHDDARLYTEARLTIIEKDEIRVNKVGYIQKRTGGDNFRPIAIERCAAKCYDLRKGGIP
jgi:hypothetical protein